MKIEQRVCIYLYILLFPSMTNELITIVKLHALSVAINHNLKHFHFFIYEYLPNFFTYLNNKYYYITFYN